jgi:MYXO-CTERM domain-containing protein
MTRLLTGTLVATALALFASHAGAHIDLTSPAPRHAGGTEQKVGPCGIAGSVRGPNITTYAPGETITVTWDETVPHPGHFRISFDEDGDDGFVNPATVDELNSAPTVLVDGIADKDGTQSYTQEVTLPNIECDNCTLQLIQVMSDKPPYDPTPAGNDIYFRCADLILGMGGSTTSTTGVTSSGATTGSTGSSTSGSTGNGTTSGDPSTGVGPGAPPTPVESGCSISSASGAGGGSSPSPLWLLAAAGAGLVRLRRRRA